MVKREHLNSLSALRKRRKALKLEMELSKREMAHSLGVARTDLKDFMLKKVAMPVGAAGLGLYVVSKVLGTIGRQKQKPEVVHHYHEAPPRRPEKKSHHWSGSSSQVTKLLKQWWPLLQTGLGFAMGYFKKDAEQPDAPQPRRAHYSTGRWR